MTRHTPYGHVNGILRFGAALLLWSVLFAPCAMGADAAALRITPNFRDAPIGQVIEAVSAATGENFIVDPRVHAQVTMISQTSLSPKAFYEAFLSMLQVYSFVAVPAGPVIKILPDTNARQLPGRDLPDRISATSDEFVTQVVEVKNVSAPQLVPILRPLMQQSGHMAASATSNLLILSDRAANVSRLIRIVRRIDQADGSEVEVIALQNASAADIVRSVNALYGAQVPEGALAVKVVADERSNSVMVSAEPATRLRIKGLIAILDTPLEAGGDSQVRYLKFADAEKLAPKLKEQISGVAQATGGTGGATASPQAMAEQNTLIWADAETNALIITAPPKIMRAVMSIVDKLDIRRAQVLVEAVIVEVSADKTSDLGVNWAAWSQDSDGTEIPLGGFVSAVGGTSIVDLYNSVQGIADDSSSSSTASLTGTTVAVGKLSGNGINYGAMIRAVRGDASTNVIATPSAVTMDNQEAELKVAQEVPFVTGQYQTESSGDSSNPFTTVQRQEVGTILKVTPQIAAEGDSVVLKIGIESSSVASTSVSSVDITTNKRTVSTTVLVEDGGIIVLGGLIQDSASKSEQRVPFLASIPLIGLAFKARDASATKSNLMIFIRPKILRDGAQTAFETGAKYNMMRQAQRKADHRELLPLLRGEKPPRLDPLPDPTEKRQPETVDDDVPP